MGWGKQYAADGRRADGRARSARRGPHRPALCASRFADTGDSMSSRKFARLQRQTMTTAETMLWRAVRNQRIDGHGFRRQTPIGPYFAISFAMRANSSSKRTAEPKIRDAERTPGSCAPDFAPFEIRTNPSSAHCRLSSSASARSCVRKLCELLASPARFRRRYVGCDGRAICPKFARPPTPHPALRAAFPSKLGKGMHSASSSRTAETPDPTAATAPACVRTARSRSGSGRKPAGRVRE